MLAAMSGGVDSAVAAWLLREQGYDVVGANMRFWAYDAACETSGKKRITSCCSPEDLSDAENCARAMGIPFYALKMESDFRAKVIEPFIMDYTNGRTPNPCVHCNTFIKFGEFYTRAEQLGFDLIATGHYARVVKLANGRYAIAPCADTHKDQAYYLYGLSQRALARTVFPLADLVKEQVRQLAEQQQLPVARKPESQEICFIPENNYRLFLKKQGVDFRAGYFRDTSGKILGRHEGAENFTVGQRRGLGLSAAEPLYVLEILSNGDVVVGFRHEMDRRVFYILDAVFQGVPEEELPPEGLLTRVQIRYNSTPAPAKVYREEGRLRVELDEPQWAITPGQAAVCYSPLDGTIQLGGKIRL